MKNQASTSSEAGANYVLTEFEMARVLGGGRDFTGDLGELLTAVLSEGFRIEQGTTMDLLNGMSRANSQKEQRQAQTKAKR